MAPTTARRLIRFFEILSFIELVLVRLIVFALFIYGACQLADKLYNLEKSHPISFNVPSPSVLCLAKTKSGYEINNLTYIDAA